MTEAVNEYHKSLLQNFRDLLSTFDHEDHQYDHVLISALSMITASLKWNGTKCQLIESLPYVKGREADYNDLLNAMANLGFTNHNVQISTNEIDERLLPCLFIPDSLDQLPIIIQEIKDDGTIIVFDCEEEQYHYIPQGKSYYGTAYFFEEFNYKNQEDLDQIKMRSGYSWFGITLERFRPLLKHLVFVSVLISLFSLAMPLFIMAVYDKVIGVNSIHTLKYLVFGVLIAILAEMTLRAIRSQAICWFGIRLGNIVSNSIFERLMLIPAQYTERASISAQISRIKAFESVKNFFTGSIFLAFIELPFILILMAAIWFIAGSLVLIPIIATFLYLLTLWFFHSKLVVAIRSSASSSAKKQQFGMETFIKLQSLRQNGVSFRWWEMYKDISANSALNTFNTGFITAVIENISHSLSVLAGVSVITLGVFEIWAENITVGALIATMIIIWRILAPLKTMCAMLPRVEQIRNSIAQVNRFMKIEMEKQPHTINKTIDKITGDIKISNVGLRYSKEVEPIFMGLNIDVNAGETVAIIGENGSGKTTILKLINSLYQPQTGNIRIDGLDIRQLEPVELRNYISYMPQHPNFFEGTIRDNLKIANPICSDSDIYHALEEVHALDDINSLELGLDTIIDSSHNHIPSGLIYRLNVARILLKESNIILLDELPNSLLNSSTGIVYKNLIERSKGSKTVFFVTHRDNYLKFADKVIVLKAGKKPQILTPTEAVNQYGEW